MEKSIKIIKDCHFCGENATSLCFECLEYFCDNCFKIIHSLKKTLNHKKEKIDLYAPIDLKCPEHSNIPINLFCIDEKGNIINYNLYNFNRIMLFPMCI